MVIVIGVPAVKLLGAAVMLRGEVKVTCATELPATREII